MILIAKFGPVKIRNVKVLVLNVEDLKIISRVTHFLASVLQGRAKVGSLI